MEKKIFAKNFRESPYWRERTSRPKIISTASPKKIDIAIIGSGYTGLCAALQTSRGGLSTVVFDSMEIGYGCSTRNGGQISTCIKPSFDELQKKYGAKQAFNILKEGQNSLKWIEGFVKEEKIECDFIIPGRFHAAHSAKHFENLVKSASQKIPGLEFPVRVISRSEQRKELGTDRYFGGVVFEKHASLDPARFHDGILKNVITAGGKVIANCPIEKIEKTAVGFLLHMPTGSIFAKEIVLATNGYTGKLVPWLRRRIIPIGSYIIATEPIDTSMLNSLMPTNRIISDSRKVLYYYRPCPDRKRIIFGGRVTSGETDAKKSAVLLHQSLINIFPELAKVKVSHSWMGFVAYSFDTLPHIGQHDGIHYAMGYSGSGVAMASYLGTRIGQKIAGQAHAKTALELIKFKTRPLYSGNPWFLPAVVSYYRWRDKS